MMKKFALAAALAASTLLAGHASAAVISNGIAAATDGYLSIDVTSGGETRTGLFNPTGAQGATDVIYDYFSYVRTGGTTYQLSGGTITSSDANQVISTGSIGTTGITWTATSVLPNGASRMTTTFDFSAAVGALLPALEFFQYLDEDVVGAGNDVFFTRGTAAGGNLELFTFDSTALFGISHGGAYSVAQGLANASFVGWAICEYNDMKPAISAGTQSLSPTGTRNAGCPTSTVSVPSLGGAVDGAYDIVSVLGWGVGGGTASARIITTLGGVADVDSIPTDPDPVPEPASLSLLGLGLAGLGWKRRKRAA